MLWHVETYTLLCRIFDAYDLEAKYCKGNLDLWITKDLNAHDMPSDYGNSVFHLYYRSK